MEVVLKLIADASEGAVNKMYGQRSVTNEDDSGNTAPAMTGEHHSILDANSNAVWTVLLVFQALSPLSKQYVMRLLFLFSPVPIDTWIDQRASADATVATHALHNEAVRELETLRIIQPVKSNHSYAVYLLNPHFRKSLAHSVMSPSEPWGHSSATCSSSSSLVSANPTEPVPPTALMEEYFSIYWENLLRLLVGAETTSFALSHSYECALKSGSVVRIEELSDCLQTMRKYLVVTKLATAEDSHMKKLKISSKGYEFMLQDTLSQVWAIIYTFIKMGKDQSDMLGLLFKFSQCRYGTGYAIAALSKSQRQTVFELSQFGLVVLPSLQSTKFYPTRAIIDVLFRKSLNAINGMNVVRGPHLANDLSEMWASGSSASSSSSAPSNSTSNSSHGLNNYGTLHQNSSSSMTIIVETNNQVVAYIHNDLHFAMLSLFVEVFLRTPNMVMGRVTRDKAKAAYKIGLKSQQIIDFLVSHAHPICAANEYVVPANVCDWLRVWENETLRINCTEAVVFLLSEVRGLAMEHYRRIIEHCRRLGTLLWCSDEKRMVAIMPAGVVELQSFMQGELGLTHIW